MRLRLLTLAAITLAAAGCGQAPAPMGPAAPARMAASAASAWPADVAAALARFSQEERRQVKAKHTPLQNGLGAAVLTVRLSAADRALLVQLYRLHPKRVEAEAFPPGLVERSRSHLATVYRINYPDRAPLETRRLDEEMMTRVYTDREGTILAYEAWLPSDDFQIFGKYDLQGRILKVDLECWN